MKGILTTFLICLITFSLVLPSHAQQFKWASGGGTIYDFSSLPSAQNEQVKRMCTDPNSNVYALSQLGDDPVTADTFHATPYGAVNNILMTSYNCLGQMRWAKLIGSSGGDCISYVDTNSSIFLVCLFMIQSF